MSRAFRWFSGFTVASLWLYLLTAAEHIDLPWIPGDVWLAIVLAIVGAWAAEAIKESLEVMEHRRHERSGKHD